MIPVKHIDPDDLALYAMHLLSPEEAAELSANLQHSTEARRLLAEIQGDLALYALSAETQAVPVPARERLIEQVARERKVVPAGASEPGSVTPPVSNTPLSASSSGDAVVGGALVEMPRRPAAVRILPWLGWAAAAALAVEAGTLYQQRNRLQGDLQASNAQLTKTTADAALASTVLDAVKDPTAIRVTLSSVEKPPPEGRATYLPSKGTLIFLASNLQPLRTDQTYELWLIPANGQAPISAGTFQPDARGNASVILPELPAGVAAKAFGVTVEQAGGSPSPTMPIILKGAAS